MNLHAHSLIFWSFLKKNFGSNCKWIRFNASKDDLFILAVSPQEITLANKATSSSENSFIFTLKMESIFMMALQVLPVTSFIEL